MKRMTFKVEPVTQPQAFPPVSNTTGGPLSGRQTLDTWHKLEDNGSGVTYFWQRSPLQNTSAQHASWRPFMNGRLMRTPEGLQSLNSAGQAANGNQTGKNGTVPKANNGFLHSNSGYKNGATNSKSAHHQHHVSRSSLFFGKHSPAFLKRNDGKSNGHQVSGSRSTTNNFGGADPSSVIWSAGQKEHTRPMVVLRKPRSRRLLHSLLCCFGAKPADSPIGRTLHHLDPPVSPGPYSPKPSEKLLLPPVRPCDISKKCLIIDLDETLVHSSFKPVKNPDFVIPVEIDGVIHQVYVLKRPYVDEFLLRIGDMFECILFTASLAKYADPVADLLDKRGVFRARLFREACVFHKGNYVKDLNRLGRDLKRVIIVDNSPASYSFHPDNAIPVQSWFDDMTDTELLDLVPIFERVAAVDNVFAVLRHAVGDNLTPPPPPPPPLTQRRSSLELQDGATVFPSN